MKLFNKKSRRQLAYYLSFSFFVSPFFSLMAEQEKHAPYVSTALVLSAVSANAQRASARAPRDPETTVESRPIGTGQQTVTPPLPLNPNIVGSLSVGGDVSIKGRFRLFEDPANGTNSITLQAADSMPSDYALKLPASAPTTNEYLASDVNGNMFWTPGGFGAGNITDGGNAFGHTIAIGANDNFGLNLKTNNVNRFTISNTGAITAPSLAGISDRYVTATNTGLLQATLPTGIKNVIQVIKDHPVVAGKYYHSIKDAVDWANANATEPTVISIAAGNFVIDVTVEVTNPFIRAIEGLNVASTVLIPSAALVGQPTIKLSQAMALTDFSLQNFSIDGSTTLSYGNTLGSTGILIDGMANYRLLNILTKACYRGVHVDADTLPALAQSVIIDSCYILVSGDCGLLVDNGAFVSCGDLIIAWAGNQEVRVQKTNALARTPELVLLSSWITDDETGTADGILAQDDAYVILESSRIYDQQNAIVVKGNAFIRSVGNLRIRGMVTHYKQVDGTARLQVAGDLVSGVETSKFHIINPSNVFFDIFDMVENKKNVGNLSNSDMPIFSVLTGNGAKDPIYGYRQNWFWLRGELFEMSEEAAGGLACGRAISAINNNAALVAFVRGLNAHTRTATLTLATYASADDPALADYTLARSWELYKRPGDHAFLIERWNGSDRRTPFVLTSEGKLGLNSTGVLSNPVSQLELGSGQLSVPLGNEVAPSYSFTGDLNTGLYSPGADSIAFSTAGLARLSINSLGTVSLSSLTSAGVVHNNASGVLSSSLIVNDDITNGTITDAKLATISTPLKVANSATTATSTNTASAIVARDGSGNFSAGTITASLTGNVTGNVSGSSGSFTGSLNGDVTGTQSATVVEFVDGLSAVNVANGANAANAATPLNTASTIVKRDGSGNFAAGTVSATLFSGPLTGNVTGNVSGSSASFTGSLSGDVTGTQGATVVSLVNGVAAASIESGATAANAATNANTANTIVKRDASGNFSAGTISAALTGAASANVLKAGDTMTGDLRLSNCNAVLENDVSRQVTLQVPTGLGLSNYALTLPTSAGSSGNVLTTDGSGVLSWQPTGSSAGYFINGGNNFGGVGPAVLGTTAAAGYGLNLIANGNTALSLSTAGSATFPSLIGTGNRLVQASATGALSATLPTGIKNTIQVIKDHPVVVGEYYNSVKDAVDWANTNATEPTAIVIAAGEYAVAATITVTNPFIKAIVGEGGASSRLVPTAGLIGSPLISLAQTTDAFSLQDFVVDATSVPAFMITPGSVGIYVPGTAYYDLSRILVQGCYQGIFVDGLTALAYETISLVDCFVLLSGDCGLLVDNGGYVFGNNVTVSYSGNQDIRAQSTNTGAQVTQVYLTASWISDDPIAGTADGVLVKDNAIALVNSSRIYYVQNAFVCADNAKINTVGNQRVSGIITHYKQSNGTASIQAFGDVVEGVTPAKFSIADPVNVFFDILDQTTGIHHMGKMTDTTRKLSTTLLGLGANDPSLYYVNNWFGHTGQSLELSEAALGGLSGIQSLTTHNSDAYTSSFIRGVNANDHTAGIILATYASDGDPSTPDWALARSWHLQKRSIDHAFQMKEWNGSAYITPFVLTAAGNLGLDSTGVLTNPVSQLQLGFGQISVPLGDPVAPSYSFTDDLNTGMYSPGADSLALATNGLSRLSIASDGGISIPTFTSAGIIHNSAAGLLSSSLIVNDDITNGTITDTKLATISTPLKVSNSATTATSTNTANAIVARDGLGNFSAGTISAALLGNVTGSLTGAASLNVLKAGDTMTGSLSLSGGSTNLTVGGTSYLQAAQTAGLLSVNNGVYFLNGVPCLPQNVLQVTKGTISGPNQFNSVKTAIDSIVGNAADNPFVVLVGPGIFTESETITLKSYVAVIGDSGYTSILNLSDPSKNVITGVHDAIVKNLWIQGATNSGSAGIKYSGGMGGLSIEGCVFANNNILIDIDDATAPYTYVNIFSSLILPSVSFATGLKISGSTRSVSVNITGFTWFAQSNPLLDAVFDISGLLTIVVANTIDVGNPTFIGGTGCRISNGAVVGLRSSSFHGFTTGISIPNVGAGPSLNTSGIYCRNNTTDISILNAAATGTLTGIFDRNKVSIDPSATLSVFFTDPVNAGTVTAGPMFLGDTYPKITNVSKQIEYGASLGVTSGGGFDEAVGVLQADIDAGTGYAMVGAAPNDYLKYITWLAQTISLTANADNFLYIDNAGIAHASTTAPDPYTTILLGKMRTNATGEVFCERMADSMRHTASELDYSWREALGPVYSSGSLVSKNGTVQLDVGSGRYFYGTIEYNPSGGTAVSWKAFYTSGASGNYVAEDQSSVDYNHYNYYDSGSGLWSRELIPSDKFARHAFYVVNDGTNEYYLLVYGQTVYDTLIDAQNGSVPPQPGTWTGNMALIASLIVKNDSVTSANYISEIRDERPRLGFKASGVSVITVHGDLQGLSADDHLQYLKTDGTRTLTGNLQMGSNNIITSGLVDGVDVSAHAARHQPGGLDALSVGTPVTIGTANSEGLLTTLARSDHVHAHGAQTDGTLHAAATITTAGFMSAADKILLNSVNPALYVLKAGDSMTGTLNITAGLNNALVINTNKFIVDSTTGNTTVGGTLSVSGTTTLSNLASAGAGIVHASTTGLLSKSLIVDADVDGAAAIADTKLATIATALKVSNSATTATSANTASAIVARDASGVFNAGSIVFENQGQVRLQDGTTNLVQLRAPLAASTYTLTFPGALGATDQILKTDASGNLSWVNGVFNGGNSVSSSMQIGSINNYGLNLQTNSVNRLEISNAGVVKIANLAAANGVVVPDATGILSSRLIVNTDVSTLSPLADNKLATISTAGKVANSATTATNLNNPSTIVLRDASGNFSAGVITASLTGNVTGNVSGSATSFTGSLSGDVTGTQGATIVSQVGGVTAANVASGANAANAATNVNTANTIVKRDASGNFAAGTITASLTGAASLNVLKSGDTMTGALTLSNSNLVLANALSNTVTLQVPAAGLSNYALILPTSSGTNGYVLTTNGSNPATLSWSTGGSTFSGSLSGDVTGTQSATVVAQVGGVSAANVASGANAANAATSVNTVNTIVKRDASGNFNAGTITASLAGNVTGSVTGAASLNVLKSGDTMTGALTLNNTQLVFGNASANTVTLQAPATLANYALTFPQATGASGTALVTDGSGNLSWSAFAPTGNYFAQGGNNFGATAVLGTTTSQALNFVTGGAGNNRLTISSTGTIAIPAFSTAGVVHNAVTTGVLSSSLIVNADITDATITDAKLATISSAGKVLNSATTATSANTANAIVARDASGVFNAGSIVLENQGQLRLRESTGGGTDYIALQAPTTIGTSYTLTLPSAVGAQNQVLMATDNAGTLSWTTNLPGYVLIGGNTVGGLMTIGTVDNYGLTLSTNNTARISIANGGGITVPAFSSAGVVHNSAAGLLSSSLIMNADISSLAGITDDKLTQIITTNKVANSATSATSVNNPSTIVSRDASGNFNAGTITASLNGNVTGSVTGAASLNVLKSGDAMSGTLTMSNQQAIRFSELTVNGTNFIALRAPASVTSDTVLTLPDGVGTSGYVLTTDGANPATLSWQPSGSMANAFINGGNSFGSNATLGTNDAYGLSIETAGVDRVIIDAVGNTTYSSRYKMSAYRSTTQLMNQAAGTARIIIFNTSLFDLNSNYDTSTGRYTVPYTGYYLISTNVTFTGGAGNWEGNRKVQLYKNAAAINGYSVQNAPAYTNLSGLLSATWLVSLVAGDIIDVRFTNFVITDSIVAGQANLSIHYMSF